MKSIELELDHYKDDLNASFGISDQRRGHLLGSIYYHFLYRNYLAESLFNENEVPLNFNRKSNVIEDVINDECESTIEQIYVAIEYGRFDARMQNEDQNLYKALAIAMMVLESFNYDKEKFLKWHNAKVSQ